MDCRNVDGCKYWFEKHVAATNPHFDTVETLTSDCQNRCGKQVVLILDIIKDRLALINAVENPCCSVEILNRLCTVFMRQLFQLQSKFLHLLSECRNGRQKFIQFRETVRNGRMRSVEVLADLVE